MPITLSESIRVLMPNGHVEEMKMEMYLAGAIAAEIGATSPLEALKAQTVASRTYVAAVQRHQEHGADVCTTSHCQKWKRIDPVSAPEVFRAVSETWGMVLMHDNQLINAFFFEHCDGHTRNSEEMLMPALPYLRSVDCACGFLAMRGHGVGMCKRGAIVMARRGITFDKILQHYYQGIEIVQPARAESIPAVAGEEEPAPTPIRPRGRRKKSDEATETAEPVTSKRSRRRASEPAASESIAAVQPAPEKSARRVSDSSVARKVVTPSEPVSPRPSDSSVTRKMTPPPASAPIARRPSDSSVTRQVVPPSPTEPVRDTKPVEPIGLSASESSVRLKTVVMPPPSPTTQPIEPSPAPINNEPQEPVAPRAPLNFVAPPPIVSSVPTEPTQEPPAPRVSLNLPVAPMASEPPQPSVEPTQESRASLDFVAPPPIVSSVPTEPTQEPPAPRVSLNLPVAPVASEPQPSVEPTQESRASLDFVAPPPIVPSVPTEPVQEPPAPRVSLNLPVAPVASEPPQPTIEPTQESRAPLNFPTTPMTSEPSAPTKNENASLDMPVIMPVPREFQNAPSVPTPPPPPPTSPARESPSSVMPRIQLSQETSSVIAKRIHVDQLPGERMIAGTLPRRGITLMIQDPQGNQKKIVSGTAPQYGDGGFEHRVEEDGVYLVTIGGRVIEVPVQGETAFIHAETTF